MKYILFSLLLLVGCNDAPVRPLFTEEDCVKRCLNHPYFKSVKTFIPHYHIMDNGDLVSQGMRKHVDEICECGQ